MTKLLTALHLDDPASLKRFLTTVFTSVTLLALNPFLSARGLPTVDDATLATVAGLVVAYLLQSGANSVADTKATAIVEVAKAKPEAGPVVQP